MSDSRLDRGRLTPERTESLLSDFDLAIFRLLPDEGSKLGFHPQIKSARQITHELNELLPPEAPHLTPPKIAGRLRSLKQAGYVIDVATQLSGRIDGWQRTSRARLKVAS